jgi:hypothetical protein
MLKQLHSHISGDQQTTWMRLLASVVLNLPVKRQIDGKDTNLGTEISWLPTNFANILQGIGLLGQKIDALIGLVQHVAAAQNVALDPQKQAELNAAALAKLINSVEQTRTTTTMQVREVEPLKDLGEIPAGEKK